MTKYSIFSVQEPELWEEAKEKGCPVNTVFYDQDRLRKVGITLLEMGYWTFGEYAEFVTKKLWLTIF